LKKLITLVQRNTARSETTTVWRAANPENGAIHISSEC